MEDQQPNTQEDLLPAYAFGITDPEESQQVEALLLQSAVFQEERDSYQVLAKAMLHSAPPIEPPPELWQQILASTNRQRWILPLMAGAAIVLLTAINIITVQRIANLQEGHIDLNEQLNTQLDLLTIVTNDHHIRFDLVNAQAFSTEAVSGFIVCHPEETATFMQVEALPVLDKNMAYQVWLVAEDGTRDSGGLFRVNTQGEAIYVFDAPQTMDTYAYIGITAEPQKGSDGPTSDPVMRGTLYDDDKALDEFYFEEG